LSRVPGGRKAVANCKNSLCRPRQPPPPPPPLLPLLLLLLLLLLLQLGLLTPPWNQMLPLQHRLVSLLPYAPSFSQVSPKVTSIIVSQPPESPFGHSIIRPPAPPNPRTNYPKASLLPCPPPKQRCLASNPRPHFSLRPAAAWRPCPRRATAGDCPARSSATSP
jgi:MYXO-CTERM domain-containing protein